MCNKISKKVENKAGVSVRSNKVETQNNNQIIIIEGAHVEMGAIHGDITVIVQKGAKFKCKKIGPKVKVIYEGQNHLNFIPNSTPKNLKMPLLWGTKDRNIITCNKGTM